MAFSIEYDFEKVCIVGLGVEASGTATLTDNGDDDFYVSKIEFPSDFGEPPVILRRPAPHRALDFHGQVFTLVASQIEDSEHAQQAFADEINDRRQPDSDRAYDERRDRQAMGWVA